MDNKEQDLYCVLNGMDVLSLKTDDDVIDSWQHFRWQWWGVKLTFEQAVKTMQSYHTVRENAMMVSEQKLKSIDNREEYLDDGRYFHYRGKKYKYNEDKRLYEEVK